MSCIEEVDNNVRASKERLALLDGRGVDKLHNSAEEMWSRLPSQYQWLRDWEWV